MPVELNKKDIPFDDLELRSNRRLYGSIPSRPQIRDKRPEKDDGIFIGRKFADAYDLTHMEDE